MTARVLVGLLLFVALSMTIVTLAQGDPFPLIGEEVNVSGNQTTYETQSDDVNDVGTVESIIDTISCVGSLGLTDIGFLGNTCTDAGITLPWSKAFRTVTEAMGDFLSILGILMTFNIPGAPTWIRFILGTTISGVVLFINVLILRGFTG